jgi:hypothetical protein
VNKTEKNIFTALTEVHQWEWAELPGVRSLVGRHVYLSIAKQVLGSEEIRAGQPLKHVMFHPAFTDRAIRMKLREFEIAGLIEMLPNETDKRIRRLVPTQALIDVIDRHARMLRQTIEKTTYCIDKDK